MLLAILALAVVDAGPPEDNIQLACVSSIACP
jgi:hypothetical protein